MNNICGYKTETLCRNVSLEEAARIFIKHLHEMDRLREQAIQSHIERQSKSEIKTNKKYNANF